MHLDAPRRRMPPVGRVLWLVALLAVCCSGATALAAGSSAKTLHLGGTWSGKYSGAYSGTFTLRWTQTNGKLKGSIALSSPHGTYGISGHVRGSAISFGAVNVGATYTGSVNRSGLAMSGTWKSPQGGGGWSAHKLLVKPK